MASVADYKSIVPAWCPGCGDYGMLTALKKALVGLGLEPWQVMVCSGIGQAAKMPHYLKANVFNGLHGRGLPAATGAKIANHELTVVAVGGDGDMYGEGGNHFIHALRRNLNLTLLVMDNRIYGLTKGQASPTSDLGIKTKVQPNGVINYPMNPLALAISQGCNFVARSFTGAGDKLADVIQQGITHRGFALIDVLQPCVSFNKVNTHAWYQQRVYDLNEDPNYDPTDFHAALDKAYEWGDRIPLGILYKNNRPAYEEHWPVLQKQPLVDQEVDEKAVAAILSQYQ